jgi:hypothetical protein
LEKSSLILAFERGLAPGGDLAAELEGLGHYEVESMADAEALVQALETFSARPVDITSSAFRHFLTLFQSVTVIGPFQYLVRRGIPALIKAYDARLMMADELQNDLLFAVKIFARYGPEEGLDRLVQAAFHPALREGYLWSVIFDQIGELDPAIPEIVARLSHPLPEGFVCIAFLDWSNRLLRNELIEEHPFDSNDGLQRLRHWLRSSDPESFSFAHSSAAALPFITDPQREQLLALAMDHPDSNVQMEAAWASAKLGSDSGIKFLSRLCLDRDFSTTACSYLHDIGRVDAIPEEANDPDFRAIADMCDWLADAREFGRPPDEIELYDSREFFWPPTNDVRQLWLFRYKYNADIDGESDDCGLGLFGSITFALTDETNPDMSPEDAYALHCCWELEMNGDPRCPEVRTIAAGRAILEAGARGEYSDDEFEDEHNDY